jgi:hypothetical protein
LTDRDPNEGSIDPMVAEYWQLGEAVQDCIIRAGFESESVEGIAVDIHDLLQAADRIRAEIGPAILEASSHAELEQAVDALRFEFGHVKWHGAKAEEFLDQAIASIRKA